MPDVGTKINVMESLKVQIVENIQKFICCEIRVNHRIRVSSEVCTIDPISKIMKFQKSTLSKKLGNSHDQAYGAYILLIIFKPIREYRYFVFLCSNRIIKIKK